MNSNWFIFNKKKNINEMKQKYGISALTSVLLCNRDIYEDSEVKMILSSNLNDLNNPSLLPDIDKGIEILHEHIKNNRKIRIVGDYDIDGVCSTYILYDSIKRLGADISYSIPDRIIDGYGINNSIIDKAINDKVDLIITCDNGISAKEQVEYAFKNNIQVIVTDHHDIGELPNNAAAIINPKREDLDTKYPFREICGAVVAWKFMTRYYDVYENDRDYVINNYLEFAMLATIGDIMPLTNENHIIAKLGLKSIVNTKNKGLKKLLEISSIDYLNKGVTAYHIGFIIGPLINAAGRMDKATLALDLFISNDDEVIEKISNELKNLNDLRKKMTEERYNKAVSTIEERYKDDKVLIIYVDGLGEQVAGIVAGRIKEKYYKPSIVLTNTIDPNEAKASCRSIEKYDIYEALSKHAEMFNKFGGHKLAAGFSINNDKIDDLRRLLNDECLLEEGDFIPKTQIDLEYPFYAFNEKLLNEINNLEPYGQGFKKPIFATRAVDASIRNIYGESKNIVQLSLSKDNFRLKGIAFIDSKPLIDRLEKSSNIDILYNPKINEFRGEKTIEINILDYR